jgi:methionine aminopeptidase
MIQVQEDISVKDNLAWAEQKATQLFNMVEKRGLITPGKTERQLNDEVVELAREHFGIETFWHKKIVRAGINTMQPYSGTPPDLIIQNDDIVILDFGPVYLGWEADLGRTYVIGNDPVKIKIKNDVVLAWQLAKDWYEGQVSVTGAAFYHHITKLAEHFGYRYGNEIAGHIVGPYPHEQLGPGNLGLDIHPENHQEMRLTDPNGKPRHWILEIHFVDTINKIGGFFEQLM